MASDQLKQVRIAVTLLLTLCVFGWIILSLHRVNYIPELFLKSLQNRENFSNYTNCIGQGFSKEYCSITMSVSSTDICQCPSGLIGRRFQDLVVRVCVIRVSNQVFTSRFCFSQFYTTLF